MQKIHIHLQKKLKKKDTKIDAFYFCPYHVDGIIKKYKKKSNLRKPDNGMFKLAQKRFIIDVKNSFMVGDQITDRLFANKSNLKYFMFKEKNLYNFIKKKLIKLS